MKKRIVSFLFIVIASALNAAPPKYVFLFIGDGMAANHRFMAGQFLKDTGRGTLAMDQLTVKGLTTTLSADRLVTDSAAASTALACGIKTKNKMLGCDPDGKTAGFNDEPHRIHGVVGDGKGPDVIIRNIKTTARLKIEALARQQIFRTQKIRRAERDCRRNIQFVAENSASSDVIAVVMGDQRCRKRSRFRRQTRHARFHFAA